MSYLRLYWKLVKVNKHALILYSVIFIGVFIVYSSFLGKGGNTAMFQDVKADIVLVDHDNSEASMALQEYIDQIANRKDVGDRKKDREDALFFGYVSSIIEIPNGFEQNLMTGKDTMIQCTTRPQETTASMLEMKINSYLSTLSIYHKADPSQSMSQLQKQTMEKTTASLAITMDTEEEISTSQTIRTSFFNYLSYILMALILLSVGMTMTTIFKSNIQKRNLMAPITNGKRNLFLLAANILFGFTLWCIFMVVICFLPDSNMISTHGLLYCVNSLVFTMLCVALGFLVSCLLTNKRHAGDALNGITNICALGGAFLGGAFVPQSMISSSILKLSIFIPNFWYVKANDRMAQVKSFTGSDIKEILSYIGIELLFLVAFICIALMIMKGKRSQESFLDARE